ncbi:MAG TPA: cyclic nucleotide-binding domain-containing protein [Bryobacteraceae bacterium]|nr:cyclic nucleotide-binding domain-containing protein [Bryobacteraceae bacterium]
MADLLAGLSQDEARQLRALGSHRSLAGGARLFQLGERAEHLFLVERGRIKLTLPMRIRDRDEEVLVEERGPGQTVGWSALIPPYRFTLTGIALLETDVLALSREALGAHFAAFPAVGYAVSLNLAAVIGQRLQVFQAMWLREVERTVELHCA